MTDQPLRDADYVRRNWSYGLRQRLANIPLISLPILKLCPSDSGGSVVHAEWRWRRCRHER
jgi:hypothetical protein